MLVLELVLTFLRRSLGKIFQAIFGWAVLAVFGQVSKREETLLSIVIGAAACWPLLVLGVVLPRSVAFFVALLPIPEGVPQEIVRAVWLGATLAVPLLVGVAFGRKRGPRSRQMPWVTRLAFGFPITIGLAAAFLIVCVTVPVGKLVSRIQRKRQEQVVLIAPPGSYHTVAEQVREALRSGGLRVDSALAPWHLRSLSLLIRKFGGKSLGAYVPKRLEFFRGSGLDVTLYPGSVALLGPDRAVARAHALIAARAPRTPALQTTSVEAQRVEAVIRRFWKDVEGGTTPRRNDKRLRKLFALISEVEADYEDWEILFRQGLQLVLELRGESDLLESAVGARAGLESAGRSAD